jgi:hypothetical protein
MIVREPAAGKAGHSQRRPTQIKIPSLNERPHMKAEKLVFLLGDSIIDNGEYVRSAEPDVAQQLEILLPHHTVVKRAVDGAKSADVR